MAGPSGAGLQADDCFAAHPVPARVKRVPGDYERVRAVAGDAAMSPNPATQCRCCPAMHIRRIVNVDADNPAMIIATVAEVSGVRIVHDPVHKSQCPTVFLRQGNEGNSVVANRSIQIHRPAGIRGTGVHV